MASPMRTRQSIRLGLGGFMLDVCIGILRNGQVERLGQEPMIKLPDQGIDLRGNEDKHDGFQEEFQPHVFAFLTQN